MTTRNIDLTGNFEDVTGPQPITPDVTRSERLARAWEDPLTTRFINGLARIAHLPGFVYVASPYTKYSGGIDKAFDEAAMLTAELVKGGMSVYSPISHCHPIAMAGGIDPLDWELWMKQCDAMMKAAVACVVLKMDGWQESKGVAMEIAYFDAADKPVLMVDPRQLLGGIVGLVH